MSEEDDTVEIPLPDIETEVEPGIFYPTPEEVIAIHHDIIEHDDDADSGVINEGHIDFALDCIENGHFGMVPETIHEKAVELLRLLSANHSFADGNKRTALNTTWTFYALNGYYFHYGEEIKAILKLFAVMENMVDKQEAVEYFEEICYTEDHDRAPSELIKFNRLFKWDQELDDSFRNLLRDMYADEIDDKREGAERMSDLVGQFLKMVSEFTEFREEYSQSLPEETIEYIDSLEEERDQVVAYLSDVRAAKEEGGISEDELERLAEKHEIDDEMTEDELLDLLFDDDEPTKS